MARVKELMVFQQSLSKNVVRHDGEGGPSLIYACKFRRKNLNDKGVLAEGKSVNPSGMGVKLNIPTSGAHLSVREHYRLLYFPMNGFLAAAHFLS